MSLGWSGIRLLDSMLICVACGDGSFQYKIELSTTSRHIQYDKMDDFSNLNGLIDNLLLCAMIHKHESFSTEQEIRISPLFVNENDKHLQCKVLNTIRQVYILNLAELCEKEGIDFEDLFDSIVIGPTSKQTVRDLQFYCKNNGLLKLANKVKKSDCPLR